ncbi:SseB family protein [Plantactinospora sp. GCM10030261]|uniref:SseB family protein n=1 Tax=Plantactinospora sp. GCM10030261 TaxID=3273420 RepID=UPI00361A3322
MVATEDHSGGADGPEPNPAAARAPWAPTNAVEERLVVAVDAGDVSAVLGIVATAALYLPGFRDEGTSATRQRVLTRDRDGVPYLPVFTSPASLRGAVEADGWRATTLAEVCRGVPAGWGLAINPVTPVGVLVPPSDVPGLVPDPTELAGFEPANHLERLLRDALGALAGNALLDLLVTARVIVPVRPVEADGVPLVPVFTSPERHAEFLAGRDLDLPTTTVDLVAVLRDWPGPECRLAVNPGSPIAFSIGGARVPGLLAYAVDLARRRSRGPGPSPPVPAPRPHPSEGAVADLLRGSGCSRRDSG